MELKRTRIFLLSIEFFAKTLWKHLVNAKISQKEVKFTEKLSLILELLILLLKSVISYYFCNAWDI